ncbi:lipoprotein [Lysobacter sp. SG-8]|uniref:Type IV secretion system putative lipoprotein virB7 n=1 Tax=Marilutibacter penaei TaxID=2759900 RepID=A0A7W3U1H3_9GAMM|nr:lipoprotein [Lysobacter penaei]MBB1087236.1 lipoprotein [Lysobacter penaei]
MKRILITAGLALLLAGCATSTMMVGQARPPIDPSQVRIYHAPPPGGYEQIAVIETASGPVTYGEQNKLNAVLNNLREEAAKVGANGVLLQGTTEGYGGTSVGVGASGGSWGGSSYSGGGIGVSVSPRPKYANGIAIYVANPPPESWTPQVPPIHMPPDIDAGSGD